MLMNTQGRSVRTLSNEIYTQFRSKHTDAFKGYWFNLKVPTANTIESKIRLLNVGGHFYRRLPSEPAIIIFLLRLTKRPFQPLTRCVTEPRIRETNFLPYLWADLAKAIPLTPHEIFYSTFSAIIRC